MVSRVQDPPGPFCLQFLIKNNKELDPVQLKDLTKGTFPTWMSATLPKGISLKKHQKGGSQQGRLPKLRGLHRGQGNPKGNTMYSD